MEPKERVQIAAFMFMYTFIFFYINFTLKVLLSYYIQGNLTINRILTIQYFPCYFDD